MSNQRNFAKALRRHGFSGELLERPGQRLMYATDNSVYQLNPTLVLQPRHADDLQCIQTLLGEPQFGELSITPYGGGTGTNGQALNNGIVVDCKRFLHSIEAIDPQQGRARVQPGVTLGQLNQALAPHGMFFAPEVSPADRATLGGMVSTDASGKGSRVYGKTSAHVLDATLLLPGGQALTCNDTTPHSPAANMRALMADIASRQGDLIHRRFPSLTREATGYNLLRAMLEPERAPHYLVAGSEGTLGLLSSLTLKLTTRPTCRAMLVVGYAHFDAALASVQHLAGLSILAIETFDETIFALARRDQAWHRVAHIFADAPRHTGCCNMLELVADSRDALQAQLDQTTSLLASQDNWYKQVDSHTEIAAMWNLRSRGVGILGNMPGARQPQAFIEDCAVDPARLPDFVAELRKLLEPHQLSYGLYGHVDVGCLHLRPALDLTRDTDRQLWRDLSRQVVVLVKQFGGVFWGEHGKGWRSGFALDYFGEELYQSMCAIKHLCDPHNQMNPGKLASPDGQPPRGFDTVPLRADANASIASDANFAQALRCNGNTVCLGYAPTSVMCPSYKVSHDLRQSPKGRATLLREWLRRRAAGEQDAAFDREVAQSMQACLGCKACAATCPIQISIPELKSRYLHAAGGPRLLLDRLLAGSERLALAGSRAPWLANTLAGNPLARLGQRMLGLYQLPAWQKCGDVKDFPLATAARLAQPHSQPQVVLIRDAVLTAYDPATLLAAARLLQRAGARVLLSPPLDSGKAAYGLGQRARALQHMQAMANMLGQLSSHATVLALEPSIALFFQQEYADNQLPVRVDFVHGWLANGLEAGTLNLPKLPKKSREFSLFSHCTEQATAAGSAKDWSRLFALLGATCHLQYTGCCGMAGWYGHLSKFADNSRKLFAASWQDTLHNCPGQPLATGFSCRTQTARLAGRQLPHPLQAIYQLLADSIAGG